MHIMGDYILSSQTSAFFWAVHFKFLCCKVGGMQGASIPPAISLWLYEPNYHHMYIYYIYIHIFNKQCINNVNTKGVRTPVTLHGKPSVYCYIAAEGKNKRMLASLVKLNLWAAGLIRLRASNKLSSHLSLCSAINTAENIILTKRCRRLISRIFYKTCNKNVVGRKVQVAKEAICRMSSAQFFFKFSPSSFSQQCLPPD